MLFWRTCFHSCWLGSQLKDLTEWGCLASETEAGQQTPQWLRADLQVTARALQSFLCQYSSHGLENGLCNAACKPTSKGWHCFVLFSTARVHLDINLAGSSLLHLGFIGLKSELNLQVTTGAIGNATHLLASTLSGYHNCMLLWDNVEETWCVMKSIKMIATKNIVLLLSLFIDFLFFRWPLWKA